MLCISQPHSGLPGKTICSHLIWPSELFLTMTTTIGSRYLQAVANSPISIVKPPSPTKAIDWRSGIGDLRRDGVRQARGHRRQRPRTTELLPALHPEILRGP